MKENALTGNKELEQQVRDTLKENDHEGLIDLLLFIGLDCDDLIFAENICEHLSKHPDNDIRGLAILDLGHLARRFRKLSPNRSQIIKSGLTDPAESVRGHAKSAASDVNHFLGWQIK